jgi:copper chaperone CopZ
MVCKITNDTNKEHMSGSVVLKISGMACSKCEDAIKNATLRCNGVKEVRVNYKEGEVIINVSIFEVDVKEIRHAIEGAGFSVNAMYFNTEI